MAYSGFDGSRSNAVRIEGGNELMASLKSLPDVIREKYITKAIQKAVKPMEAALLANTPMGPTGNLKAAVGTRAFTYSSGVGFGVVGYKRAVSVDTSDNKGYHSHFIEFGTKDRVPKRGPFLSSYTTYKATGWTPQNWSGAWPMLARRIRGSRALHPLGNAYAATSAQCLGILVAELEAGLEKGIVEARTKGL